MVERWQTITGKFDARCQHCLRAVYRLWIADTPPPTGCSDGYDHDISKCSTVYNALVSIVIRQDHLLKPLTPEQDYILNLLGAKAAPILSHIRSGAEPPHHKLREPDYNARRHSH